jgi:lipopolysaccharide biosynthesis regulator YciM
MSPLTLPPISTNALRVTLKALYRQRSELDLAIRRLERNRLAPATSHRVVERPRVAEKA